MLNRKAFQVRPGIEALEDRCVLASLTLNNLNYIYSFAFSGTGATEQWHALGETGYFSDDQASHLGMITPFSERSNLLTVYQAPNGIVSLAGMSRNGNWIIGSNENGSYRWSAQAPTKPKTIAVNEFPFVGKFTPESVSNNGIVVGELAGEFDRVPAYWSETSGFHVFHIPTGNGGTARFINQAGTLAVGQVKDIASGDSNAASFTKVGVAKLLAHTGYQNSEAITSTSSGSLIAGTVTTAGYFDPSDFGNYVQPVTYASVWDADGQHTLQWSDGSLVQLFDYQNTMFLTDEGYLAGNTPQGPFIWAPSFDGIHSQFLGRSLWKTGMRQ
ncbi:MAG: hypothetical protein QM703_14275 [Gemmatales bacterium]